MPLKINLSRTAKGRSWLKEVQPGDTQKELQGQNLIIENNRSVNE